METDPIIKMFNEGLGKDKPVKLWIDDDCTSFDNFEDKTRAHFRQSSDVDDGWSICSMLNSDRCEIVGFSSTYGNDHEYWTYQSIKKCVELHKSKQKCYQKNKPPVYHGATETLRSLLAGGTACWINKIEIETLSNEAIEALHKTLKELPKNEKLYIWCGGPGTNIAKLILLYPELKSKIGFVSLFMGRRSVIYPKFNFGSLQKEEFEDFNFLNDPLSISIILKSNVPVVLSGVEIAKNSLWIYRSDIEELHSKSTKDTLIHQLTDMSENSGYPLPKWVKQFQSYGKYVKPWPTNENIDGFVPFNLMAATQFFASERLTISKVTPSMNIVSMNDIGNLLSSDMNEKIDKDNEKEEKEKESVDKNKIGYFGIDTYLARKFGYMLCTDENPSADNEDVVIEDKFTNLKNVYYIPSIRGEKYPWKDYKEMVLKQLLKEMD